LLVASSQAKAKNCKRWQRSRSHIHELAKKVKEITRCQSHKTVQVQPQIKKVPLKNKQTTANELFFGLSS